ncbi:MAG: response regulator [Planctomycetes bacterium]|nr:response regulator [Planctomycetota bacterium]
MLKILVVEDSRLSRRIIVDALKDAGYDVMQATNGAEALESYHQDHPDCIVTDMLMPVMDGQEFLRRLRAIDADVPVIVLSADIQKSTRSFCEELGISAFLNKPVDSQELLDSVEAALVHLSGVTNNDVS